MSEEKEFLKNYRIDEFTQLSLATDIAAFRIRRVETENYKRDFEIKLSVLLVKRGVFPFKDKWALPGGFIRPGETVEECAFREISEETGVVPVSLIPIGIFSKPGRDPRGWIVSGAYISVIGEGTPEPEGGDDAEDACWFDIIFTDIGEDNYRLELLSGDVFLSSLLRKSKNKFGITEFSMAENSGIAFDHPCIIASAVSVLRENAERSQLIFDFLPEKFTLTELQNVYDAITGGESFAANFRRKISPYVEETDEIKQGAGHRPAKLFRKKSAKGEI